MSRNQKLLFLAIFVCLTLFLIIGLGKIYSIEAPLEKLHKEVIVDKPADKIGIAHTEIFGALERPQVIFDHNKHVETLKKEKGNEGCKACHPVDKKDELVFDFPRKAVKKNKKSIMNAYHDECIDCHKKKKSESKKSGPVNCGDCHQEKDKYVLVKYPVVEFNFEYHDKHVKKLKEKFGKEDCGLCHHIYDINEEDEALRLVSEDGTEESCYYCHDLGVKRGPELAAITKVSARKGLSIRNASHLQCLNCHVKYQEEYIKKGEKDACPTECIKCHTGKYKTVSELEKIPRPDRNQTKKPFINIENAKLKGVPFDHTSHEKTSKTCRECHHETLNACKKCHVLSGSSTGKWVNTASAYHDTSSQKSCAGCHRAKQADKNCAGCHHAILPVDIETMDPKKGTCTACHTGKKEPVVNPPQLSVNGLDPKKVKKEVTINILEKEYEPSKFPHLEMIKKLVKISNDNKMAAYFHKNMQTICEGCHHQSRAEAEVQKDTPPFCRNCHALSFDPRHLNRPRLLAAYHRQCVNCHESMDLEKARKCKECHKEKTVRPADIISKISYNEAVAVK